MMISSTLTDDGANHITKYSDLCSAPIVSTLAEQSILLPGGRPVAHLLTQLQRIDQSSSKRP